jgi:2-polyprenyl-6-methoxyphenol hydroxylase-like FAD-dependent oxidoreductase
MKILVCGAGVAGLATTIYLQRAGHDVTLLELAAEIRTAGGPVDVRDDSVGFVRELGLYDEIKANQIHLTANIEFVDDDGIKVESFPASHFFGPEDIEIGRTELMPILIRALSRPTDLRFSTSITSVGDRGEHVHAVLSDGHEGDYDLVIGADGVHSATRRMAFGRAEVDYAHFLGVYCGFAPIGPPALRGTPSKNYNSPGKLIASIQSDDFELCTIMFRSHQLEYDYHDPKAIRRILLDHYPEDVWRTQELINRAVASSDLWMDECTQIKMDSWRKGRVVLVGDAAHCATPLAGQGVSLGISGGRFLSMGLKEFPDDLDAALARYDELQRPYVDIAQAQVYEGMEMLIPATEEAIQERNMLLTRMAGA